MGWLGMVLPLALTHQLPFLIDDHRHSKGTLKPGIVVTSLAVTDQEMSVLLGQSFPESLPESLLRNFWIKFKAETDWLGMLHHHMNYNDLHVHGCSATEDSPWLLVEEMEFSCVIKLYCM